LNALNGKSIHAGGSANGPWNYTNAELFIQYTVGKNYDIHGWELGEYMDAALTIIRLILKLMISSNLY
jgi:heparanase 1